MRKRRVLLALAAFLLVAGTASAGGTEPTGDGQLGIDYRDRGPVAAAAPDSTRIDLVLLLDADDRALARDALAVSSPGSSDFRRYLEPRQIARRYGADRSAIRRVISHLEDRGIEARPGIGGMWVEADPTIRQAELLFSTELGSFSSDGERFVAPTRQPEVPDQLLPEVTGVVGLDTEPITEDAPPPIDPATTGRADPAPLVPLTTEQALETNRFARSQGTSVRANLGTPKGCAAALATGAPISLFPGTYTPGYTPNQIHTAYGINRLFGSGFKGQGGRIAVVEVDGFKRSDLEDAADCFGYRAPPTPRKLIGLKQPLEPGPETTLDLQVISAALPEVPKIQVVESKGEPSGWLGMYRYLLGLPKAKRPSVISSSVYAACEAELAGSRSFIRSMERVAQMAAAMGISMLSAAGDTGSSGCALGGNSAALGVRSVQYWSSSPWLTSVGGTNITLNESNGIDEEVVWNDSPIGFGGGGGGSSLLFRKPSWQRGPGVGKAGMRSVPDLALLADGLPGWTIRCTIAECGSPTGWVTVGGTSAATPLTASIVLLANQKAKKMGQSRLGFLNPSIYELARDPSARKAVFRDITSIGNDLGPLIAPEAGGGGPLGCCKAGPGYDRASGWGSISAIPFAKRMIRLAGGS